MTAADEVLSAIDAELEGYVEWHPDPDDLDVASWAADGSHENFRELVEGPAPMSAAELLRELRAARVRSRAVPVSIEQLHAHATRAAAPLAAMGAVVAAALDRATAEALALLEENFGRLDAWQLEVLFPSRAPRPPAVTYTTTGRDRRGHYPLVSWLDEAQDLPAGASAEISYSAAATWDEPLLDPALWEAANPRLQVAPRLHPHLEVAPPGTDPGEAAAWEPVALRTVSLEPQDDPNPPRSRSQRRSAGVDAQRSPYGPPRASGRR